jgi:hypothetical protein
MDEERGAKSNFEFHRKPAEQSPSEVRKRQERHYVRDFPKRQSTCIWNLAELLRNIKHSKPAPRKSISA